MKKVYPLLKAITGVFFTMMFTVTAMSQTLIPAHGSNSMNSNGTLCTHLGCGAGYWDNVDGYTVVNVTPGNRVQISGSYNIEWGCDFVQIFSGSGTGGTLLATYNGVGNFCYTGNFGETLTVRFYTDFSVIYTGLNANVLYNPVAPADPTSASASSPVICNGTSTSLSATGAVGTVYWYSGSCGGTLVGTGNPLSVSPSSTTTYYARNFNNCVFSAGCASTTVSVNPVPTVDLVLSQEVCNGNNSSAINFTGTVPGTVYNWTNSNTAIGLAASGTGNIPSFTATYTGNSSDWAMITVIPEFTNAGVTCTGSSGSTGITVNATPIADPVSDVYVCHNAASGNINFSSPTSGGSTVANPDIPGAGPYFGPVTFNWTNDNTGIGLGASGTGAIPSFTAVNNGTKPDTANITVIPSLNSGIVNCTGNAIHFRIIINPKGQVNAVSNAVLCSGSSSPAFNFNTNNTGGTTTYAWTNDKTSIGLSASGTGNIASFTATNSTASPVVATITFTPTFTNGGTGCAGTSMSFTITVNPTPSVNQPSDQVICNNASSAPVSFGNKVLILAADAFGWVNEVKAKIMATGAFSTIDVINAANVTPTVAQLQEYQSVLFYAETGYANSTLLGNNLAAYVDGGGGLVMAVFSTASVPVSGAINTSTYQVMVPAGQTQGSTQTLGTVWLPAHQLMDGIVSFNGGSSSYRSTSNSLAPGGYRVADWNDGGYLITARDDVGAAHAKRVDLGFFPPSKDSRSDFWDPASDGAKIIKNALQYVGGGGGTFDYSWTNDNTSIGLAASGTGDIASFTAVNTGTAPVTANLTVIPSFTYGGVTCTGVSRLFTITVNPSGQVNDPTDQVVCNSATTTAVNFATNNTGGTTAYSWTNNNTSIGLAASGTGNIAAFTATNTSTAPVTATITVTPTFTNGATSCSGTAQTFTITVNPTAQVNQPASYTVCNNTAATATNFATVNTGGTTTYAWTNDNTTIGLAASGSGNIASFTAVNTGTSPVTATIVVTPTFTNTGVSCTGASKTFFITVNPTGQVNDPADQVICNSGSTAAVNFATVNTGGTTTYAWTNDNATIGLAASGTGNIASFTATNSGNSPVTATITVTPTFSNAAPGVQEGAEPGIPPSGANCSGPAQTFTITVNPTAQVNPITNKVVCNSDVVPTIYFGTVVSGGATYCTWTNDNTSIGLAASGAAGGWINSFTAVNNGTTPQVATITVTPTFTNGGVTCSGPSVTFTITVNPTAQVNVPANQVKCNTTSTDAITFATTNTGGTTAYSWTNSNTSIGLAASGNGDIASFTATNSGNAPATATITVTPAYTNAGVTCSGPAQTFKITVNPTGQVDQPADLVVCNGAPTAVTYTTANTGGTTTYSWTNTNTTIGLAASGTGNIASFAAVNNTNTPQVATITVTPTFTNGGVSCSGPSKTFTITVNATPTITCPANINVVNDPGVCGATVTYAPATVTGAPTPTVSYSMPSGSVFPIGTTTVTVTATNVCAVVTCSFTVTVRDTELPVITCPSNITVTATGACTKVVNYTVTATDNCPGFTIVRTAGLASGSAFPLGVTTVTHRVTDASGNISTCSFTVTVLDGQIPAISTQPVNTTVCAGSAASFNVASTNVVSYLWQAWNGTGWSDISGSNNAVYTVNNTTLNMNTNTYRVTVIGLCNNAISNIATVYVNPNPFVTITASGSPAMIPGQFLTLTANVSISGGTYKWYKNGELMSGVTGDVIDGLTVDNAGTYKVVYTDGNGCTSASAELQLTASESTKLFAYPNPNNGEFSVRFYNAAGEQVTLSIYNDRGRLVYQRKYATSAPYTSMEVNMLKEGIMSSGYFMVEVRDHNGKQIAVKTVIVYR